MLLDQILHPPGPIVSLCFSTRCVSLDLRASYPQCSERHAKHVAVEGQHPVGFRRLSAAQLAEPRGVDLPAKLLDLFGALSFWICSDRASRPGSRAAAYS